MHNFLLKISYLFPKYYCIWLFIICGILFLYNQGYFLFSKKINFLCTFGIIVKVCRSLLNRLGPCGSRLDLYQILTKSVQNFWGLIAHTL
jgi:hypothetical protein